MFLSAIVAKEENAKADLGRGALYGFRVERAPDPGI